jgi:hypothetical protein
LKTMCGMHTKVDYVVGTVLLPSAYTMGETNA